MKRYIGLLALLLSISAFSQNTVKMSAVKSNDYAVAYSLPKTAIRVKAIFSKKIRKTGEFYRYAGSYLNISHPITEDEIIYSLDKVEAETVGIPDENNSYMVEFKTNTIAPFVMLTKDGLICAINEEVGFSESAKPSISNQPVESKPVSLPVADPRNYFSEEILRAGSTAKQAELIAKQIYHLRESKTNILTGEADNMPPDGEAYQLAISQIDEQEKSLTSAFSGTETIEEQTKTFTIIPGETDIPQRVVFRFSKKLGVVEANNLAGAPVTLTLTSKTPIIETTLTEKEQKALDKKFSSGIIYNIPAKADLKIEYDNRVLLQKECDVVQFGTKDVLTPKMLDNGKQPIKVIFYPELGAIKQIVQ